MIHNSRMVERRIFYAYHENAFHEREIYPNKTSLIERDPALGIRREITWLEFDNLSNQLANALISHGIKKNDKVAILMMNCLEWLPIYFGVLKTGALAVPLNFRFTADEIRKCLETAGTKVLIFGPEFEERVKGIVDEIHCLKHVIFVGDEQLSGISNFFDIIKDAPAHAPEIDISDDEDAALYLPPVHGCTKAHNAYSFQFGFGLCNGEPPPSPNPRG